MLQQAISSLYFAVFGVTAAIAYDLVRFLRAIFVISYPPCGCGRFRKLIDVHMPTENVPRLILISLLDLVYFACLTAVAAVLLFHISFGVLRWYFVVAFILGFAAYRVTLSRLLMPCLTAISIALRALVGKMIRAAIFPIKYILRHTAVPIALRLRKKRRIRYTRSVIRSLEKAIMQ